MGCMGWERERERERERESEREREREREREKGPHGMCVVLCSAVMFPGY
jgi:hypothetical protein